MRLATTIPIVLTAAAVGIGQEHPLPPPPRVPVLRIDHPGPAAPVTAVALAPDGTLYAGGLEKLVRRYRPGEGGWTELDPLRVPIGPANSGAVNAVAVSPDGKAVAVAGRSPMRNESNLAEPAVVVDPRFLPGPMRRDLGVIYLIDPANPNAGRVLRGHLGPVLGLAFADPSPKAGPVLVSAAIEPDPADSSKSVGVVRAWDTAAGKEIGVRSGFPAIQTRPGLAAWVDAAGVVRVAVAWPGGNPADGGQLTLWQPATGRAEVLDDAALNFALTCRTHGDATSIVSGGFAEFGKTDRQHGRLAVRPAVKASQVREIPFPMADRTHYLPLAVANAGDDLAVLLETVSPTPGRSDRPAELRLLTADGQLRGRVGLTGLSRGSLTTLTATGTTIAVGGYGDDRVETYRTADLVAGKPAPTVIAGASRGFGRVAFLADHKLWVGTIRDDPTSGGLVFDLTARKVARNDGKSPVDSPRSDAKIVLAVDRKPAAVVVRDGQRETVIPLRKAEVPTAAVMIPADKAGGRSAVAVAHTDPVNRVTLVSVFDAQSGRRVRQYVGPERTVRGLAVSGEHPLLAAVGDDPVVSVWSLKPLGTPTGAIDGLSLTERDGAVVVADVSAAAHEVTRASLKPGDGLTAVGSPNGKPEAVATPAEFLFAVRTRPVGGKVAVTVRGRPDPVVVPVGRAVEQQGPLFSLWIDPTAAERGNDWVGWSPSGPYDASSPAAERRIGWATNTGDPTHPAGFAGADQYRNEYYKPDLLRFLADKGDLSTAVGAWWDAYPPAELKVRLLVPGTAPGPAGRGMVRTPPGELRVMVQGVEGGFPVDRAVVELSGTDAAGNVVLSKSIPLAEQPLRFSIDLSEYPWTRGGHRFQARLRRDVDAPPIASTAADVLFVPPAPQLTVSIDGRPATGEPVATMKPTADLAARVQDLSGLGADVTLTVIPPGGREEVRPLTEPASLNLEPGRTRIRVRAVNRDAGEFAGYESAERVVSVDYTPPEIILPPVIDAISLTPTGEPTLVDGRRVSVVDRDEVQVSAAIAAAKPLTAVEWDTGDGEWQPVDLGPGPRTSFAFRQPVRLKPGEQRTVRVRARVDKADPAVASVAVVYHPPLPTVVVDPIPGGPTISRTLRVSGTFDKATVRGDFRVQLASAAGTTVRIVDAVPDVVGGTWSAVVGLSPGVNDLGLVVRNDWREDVRSNLAGVTYRRPPRIVAVAPVDAGATAVADVTVIATTDDDPALSPTTVIVDGIPVRESVPAEKIFTFLGTAWWQTTAPAVPIKTGDRWRDALRIELANVDGSGPSVVAPVTRTPKPTRPPVIAVADGDRDRTTDRPVLPVNFRIASETPLSRSAIWVTTPGQPPRLVSESDPAAAVGGDGSFVLTGEETVGLSPGVNRVKLVAVNAGGESTVEFAVGYTLPALRMVVDAVEDLGPGRPGEPLARVPTGDGGDQFRTADSGFVAVRGRVLWSSEDAPYARSPGLNAVLSVNQVNHLPVQVDLPTGRAQERSFAAPIFLNAADSGVTVELRAAGRLGAMPQERLGSVGFRVACAKPITAQRLHVVVVGVNAPRADRFDLVKDVVLALGGAEPGPGFDNGEFRHPAFDQAVVYPPVVGAVDDGRVAWALDEVDRRLKRDGSGRPGAWLNDVVLVYYQGSDWVGPDGRHWLHTSRSMKYPGAVADRFAVDVGGLPDTPGVRLVLLNVTDSAAKDGAFTERTGPTGPPLLRYVWKDPGSAHKLLDYLASATASHPTLGGVVADLRDKAGRDPASAVVPYDRIPDPLGRRRIGPAVGRPE